jgi:cation diffusion facilitator family transporter
VAVAFVGNTVLMIGKLVGGWGAGSQALFADGLHSFTDVLSTIASGIGTWIGGEPPDENHPYGHGNAENIAALVVAGIMGITGIELLREAAEALTGAPRALPGMLAAGVAAIACVVKELMHRHAIVEARATGSPAVLALARDHRSDVLSSLAALGGVVLARHVHPVLDTLASVVIAGFILSLSWETASENIAVLMDEEPDLSELAAALEARAAEDDEVVGIRRLRGHPVGGSLHLQLDLLVPPQMTVAHAHEVAHRVEDWAKEIDNRVDSVQVHVEPGEA